MFLLPGIIIAMYVTKTPVPEEWKVEITRYLSNMQRTGGDDDQGWGIHIEARSSVFGTGLNYVAMRLLGVDAEVDRLPFPSQRCRTNLRRLTSPLRAAGPLHDPRPRDAAQAGRVRRDPVVGQVLARGPQRARLERREPDPLGAVAPA